MLSGVRKTCSRQKAPATGLFLGRKCGLMSCRSGARTLKVCSLLEKTRHEHYADRLQAAARRYAPGDRPESLRRQEGVRRSVSLPGLQHCDGHTGTTARAESARKAQGFRPPLAAGLRLQRRCLPCLRVVCSRVPGKSHYAGSNSLTLQCAFSQFGPTPTSTASGTSSFATPFISLGSSVVTDSTSESGTSSTSSSCTCMISRDAIPESEIQA